MLIADSKSRIFFLLLTLRWCAVAIIFYSSKCSRSIELCFRLEGLRSFLKLVCATIGGRFSFSYSTDTAGIKGFFDLLTFIYAFFWFMI